MHDALKVASCFDFSMLINKSVMITGANGLIGINFLSSLTQIANKVHGITIIPVMHTNTAEFLRPFIEHHSVRVYTGDLTDEKFIETLPRADVIIHAAGSGEPSKFISNGISSLKINTLTTFKLIEKLNNDGKFLFISSSDIYNGLNTEIFSEEQIGTTNTEHPRACYIEGKRTGETICNLSRLRGVKAFSVRLSLTYGPGTKLGDQRVLPSFIQKALKGQIELLDSGEAHRNFCYISDAIEMMWYVLLYGKFGIYNVGGVTSISIKELAYLIGQLASVPVLFPAKAAGVAGAPRNVCLELKRILSDYNKVNFVSMEDGLVRTINWYRHLR